MNLATWSLRNPSAAILIFILLTLAGLWGFKQLHIQDFPDLDFPIVQVQLMQPGAAPSQLETEIARKAEDALNNVQKIRHINTDIQQGSVLLVVEFELGKSLSDAVTDIKSALDRIRSDLPADMLEPQVSRIEAGPGGPTVMYAVSNPQWSEEDLSWFIDDKLAKKMRVLTGVAQFVRLGGVQREIQILLDPIKLNALGVTAGEVSQAIGVVQQENSGGQGQLGGRIQGVRTTAIFNNAQALNELSISLPNGQWIKLNQVATIQDTQAERSQAALLDGKPAIGFQIMRARGYDEKKLADKVAQAAQDLKQEFPGIKIELIQSSVPHIMEQYHGSMHMLFEGALLAILVIYWFLRDWRATLMGAIALPLSIIPTFAFMNWAGFSINTITLLAMAVVVGVLVDDAIVEVENIARHQQMGKSVKQATIDAVNEIALAVLATTATLVVVFLPTALMSGIPGLVFKQFGWTLVIAVLISLLVARIVTPMMAVYLLKTPPKNHTSDTAHPWAQKYLKTVQWCLHHRKTTLGLATAFFFTSIFLASFIPAGFIPSQDVGLTTINIETPPGSSLEATLAKTEQVRLAFAQVPGIKTVFTSLGAGGQQDEVTQGEVRKASLTVVLQDRSQRPSQTDTENAIRRAISTIPGIKYSVLAGGPGEKLMLILTSDNNAALISTAQIIEHDIRTAGKLSGVTSTASLEQQEIQIIPNLTLASDLGITTQEIGETVRIALSGDFNQSLAKLNLDQRQLNIKVMLPVDMRESLIKLAELRVRSKRGLVPLSSVADIRLGSAPSRLQRLDRQRQVTVYADLGGYPLGQALDDVKALPSVINRPSSVKILEGGDAEIMVELLMGFVIALLTGIFCVYAVMVLLFKNWLQPITILSAVPLSAGGAFVALLLGNMELGLPAMIGLVMLLGIVTKNSILLVDFAMMATQDQHLGREAAIIDACLKRARPILMTSIAMVAGMLPLALGFGGDAGFRQPMAMAVIGGLMTSTALSLLVVPVVFSYVYGLEQKIARRFPSTEGDLKAT